MLLVLASTSTCNRTLLHAASDQYGSADVEIRDLGGRGRVHSEKDAKLAQKLGQLQLFIAVFPQESMGQLAFFGPT